MKSYACSGHVVKTESLTKLIPETKIEEWNKYLKENDNENCQTILEEFLPKQYPCPDSTFVPDDECETEDLELNVMYSYFDRESLFETVKKPALSSLQELNINPEFSQWVVWG